MENTLTIRHKDGDQRFNLAKGGYTIESGRISISLQTENLDAAGFPPCAYLCLENHPLGKPLGVGDVFQCLGGMDQDPDSPVRSFGYFSFHASKVFLRCTVLLISDIGVRFKVEATHDDVKYYDERARECPTQGVFTLSHLQKSDLWMPG